MENELCPFCGESVDLELGQSTEDREGIPSFIYCATCGAQGPWLYVPIGQDAYAKAMQKWNARYEPVDNGDGGP
jgi:Lar family restriction alleviation protein